MAGRFEREDVINIISQEKIMAKAFKCALSGEVADGEGIKHVDVPVGENVFLRVVPFLKRDKNTIVQDEMGQKAADAIADLLKGLKV